MQRVRMLSEMVRGGHKKKIQLTTIFFNPVNKLHIVIVDDKRNVN